MTDFLMTSTHCTRCGQPFQILRSLWNALSESSGPLYCPNGHKMTFGESTLDKVRRERDRAVQEKARLEEELATAERVSARARAETKRLKKRAAAGTCPCCQRTFSNMATHMKKQHPDYVKDTGANVVPIKVPSR